jgi:DNA-binding NtrC family response regulator
MSQLQAYAWPGNVRELQSVLKQALLKSHGTMLLPESLPKVLTEDRATKPAAESQFNFDSFIFNRLTGESTNLYAEAHLEVDRVLLKHVLQYTEGNQFQASRILGIARQTLRNRLRDLGLNIVTSVEAGEHA